MVVVVGQPITDPISGPSFDFTFTIGPELDKICHGGWENKESHGERKADLSFAPNLIWILFIPSPDLALNPFSLIFVLI